MTQYASQNIVEFIFHYLHIELCIYRKEGREEGRNEGRKEESKEVMKKEREIPEKCSESPSLFVWEGLVFY